MSGEQLAKFIESAFNQMNVQQLKKRTDANSFDICGLNPYSDDLTAFHKHLDSIEENKCYAAMIKKKYSRLNIKRIMHYVSAEL